ncbi:putative O-glycosylation ligase, exosortase A system-associated [Sphingosinicella sp. YJ22]|uniref:putative O-glycosylation ligase, exosortase A system-associated n=1 Tax=Sphingosinicella sp. YJ22 TaxID=1104780 RepID=UPI00140DFBAF|nr:putative O-glycosylation ligase, exosortase A system-associated [Sphingosinicella sp. YJ22]
MRDLGLLAFIGAFAVLGLKRPFLWVLLYAYIDIIAPQRLGFSFLAGIPNLSLIAAALAIGGWLLTDAGKGISIATRQLLMLALLAYAGVTTINADVQVDAWAKWDWAWKAVFFAIFLPFTLRTMLRIEAYLLTMLLCAAALIISGGIKTALGGGGYGSLVLLLDDNSGLYEGSTISTVAIAMIPLVMWFSKHGTIFPPDGRVRAFCYALCFACLLIPIGTQARTGLVCIAALFLFMLRDSQRRILYLAGAGFLALAAVPFLPASYTSRMTTIQEYQADQSAGTRIAVWGWTLEYVKGKPFGGGFEAYRQNRIQFDTVSQQGDGTMTSVSASTVQDAGRAWHSAYFEMLGEQGFPGLVLWLLIHAIGLIRMERLRRRYRDNDERPWIAPLATALQNFQLTYLVGALFVGIAFQPFVWMILGVQVAFDRWVTAQEKARKGLRFNLDQAAIAT